MPPPNPPPHGVNDREQNRRNAIFQKLARMGDGPSGPLATGFEALDRSLGGGLPRGRIVEIFGPPASGKTSLALHIAGSLQRAGSTAAWIDADRTFDPAYTAELGIELDKLPVVQPATTESAMAIARRLMESNLVDLIVVDPAAALVPALELEMGIGDQSPGLYERVLASELRTVARIALRSGVTVLLLNPSREEHDSAGAAAVKLHCWVRISLRQTAYGVRFRVVKNKAAGGPADGEIRWGSVKRP